MKKYRQLVEQLPSKKVVLAFNEFQSPAAIHETLISTVKKTALLEKADHVIFASCLEDKRYNPLPVDRKIYFLNRMFPNTNFIACNKAVNDISSITKTLLEKYKEVIVVTNVDLLQSYTKLLENYNIKVIITPESSGVSVIKMLESAKKGDFSSFKRGLPYSLIDLDGKRLMNEMRQGMNLEVIKEEVKFQTSELREQYRSGIIFNVGDKVTDSSNIFEVVSRGSNYITVVNEFGDMSKKWLDAVQPINIEEDIQPGYAPKEINYKGYTTKNFNRSADAAKAFQYTIKRSHDPVAVLNALKATDMYMGLNDKKISGGKFTNTDKETWFNAHEKARESLNKIGEFLHHEDYWNMHQHELEGALSKYKETGKDDAFREEYLKGLEEMNFTLTNKIKVANIVASSLGYKEEYETANPETIINNALESINKVLTIEAYDIITNMLSIASDAGINYDKSILEAVLVADNTKTDQLKVGSSFGDTIDCRRRMKVNYCLGEEKEDFNDNDIDDMINELLEDDYLDAYEDFELAIVDEDTGEFICEIEDNIIMEVLSRQERIKAKVRFARSESKRERKTRIALKTHSNVKTINKRARKLAIEMMKKRITKKPSGKLSVAEKERVESIIAKRKVAINRLAMKLAPKIRKIESDRLSHKVYTKKD